MSFHYFYGDNGSFGTRKTFLDKSDLFDLHRELMSLQDSLMPPLKPQARKTGGLLKTDQEALIGRFRYSIEGPKNRLKAPLERRNKTTGGTVTKIFCPTMRSRRSELSWYTYEASCRKLSSFEVLRAPIRIRSLAGAPLSEMSL